MTTPKPKASSATQVWEPYPELDLEPKDMEQVPPIYDLRGKLRYALFPEFHYPYHPTILVGGEIPIYYETDGRTTYLIPDCLVAFDVDSYAIRARVGYDPIQNGKPPDWVMEVGSHSTHRNDSGHKRDVYRILGIPEYWRFDPSGGDYYGEPIIGEHLVDGQYQRFPSIQYPDGSVGATSPMLNLNFRWREWRFRIHSPDTGQEYEDTHETVLRLEDTNTRLQDTNTRLQRGQDRLQEEVDRLQAENRRLRGEG